MRDNSIFKFKKFAVKHEKSKMKVGFDGILLGAWANTNRAGLMLDIGTGTGILALMQAQKNEKLNIIAIEPDLDSYLEAKENILNSDWHNRIKIKHTTLQSFARKTNLKFDYIICNPPFFDSKLKYISKDKAIARHTVSLSHKELIGMSANLMKNKAALFLILPYDLKMEIIEMAKNFSLFLTKSCEVYTNANKRPKRLLLRFEKGKSIKESEENVLYIYDKSRQYSEKYLKIVKDFYIWLK